jgi:hypothetical protein
MSIALKSDSFNSSVLLPENCQIHGDVMFLGLPIFFSNSEFEATKNKIGWQRQIKARFWINGANLLLLLVLSK